MKYLACKLRHSPAAWFAFMTGLAKGQLMLAMNDGSHSEKLQDLRDSLLDLNERIQTIQAAADSEKRDLTEDETNQVESFFSEFQHTEAEIDRRQRIIDQTNKLRESMGPTAEPNNPTHRAATSPGGGPARQRVPRIEVIEDRGKWGWKNMGDFAQGVRGAVIPGGTMDPRLIANAPTTVGTEGVGEDGGFAVPPDFRSAIMQKVAGEESLLARTDQLNTGSNGITFPMDETTPWQTSGGIQVYWMDEGGQITQSKPQLKEHTQRLNRLAALVPVTEDLLGDAPALDSYLKRKTPEKLDFAITDAIINGTGAGKPQGMLVSPATITQAKYTTGSPDQSADTIVYQNVREMWTRLYGPCRANAVWLIHHEVEDQLFGMEFDFQNASKLFPVYLPPGGASSDPFGRLMGRPVIVTQACQALGDKGDIILADLSQYLTIMKTGGIRQDVSMHLWFDYDVQAFRFIFRITGRPWWSSSITPKNGTTTQSCFVTLAERA